MSIDRGALIAALNRAVDGYDTEVLAAEILALVHPVESATLTRDRLRTELAASLPADPKWVAWVDGALDRLEAVEGVTLRRCSWEECPGLEKSIPMHEQEDGPELHDVCKAAMIAPEAVHELTELYAALAAERKARPTGVTLTEEETGTVLKVLRWAADFTGVRDHARLKALAARLGEASS